MINEQLNEALKAVREVRLDKKSDDELRVMIGVLRQWQAIDSSPQAKPYIEEIQNETNRRQLQRGHGALDAKLQAMLDQDRELHRRTIARHNELKVSVDGLRVPHWTVKPGFVVIFLTMVFAAIAAWPVIREWIPDFRLSGKAASFQPQQSNSAPVIPTGQRTSPVAPASTRGTNYPKP
jgi:hypothetical protein